MEQEKSHYCPEYCPFLKANNSFCELFKCNLQTQDATLKCEQCLDPVQRQESYKKLGLTEQNRIDIWQKAVVKHNEIELGKKRQEEDVRRKFTQFLEENFSSLPPLEGNVYLQNIVINLFMVMDATERSMMMSVLGSKGAQQLLMAIDRSPKDESLLRSVRHELDIHFKKYENAIQNIKSANVNSR